MSPLRSLIAVAATAIVSCPALAQGPLVFQTLDREAEVSADVRFDGQPDDCAELDESQTIEQTAQIGFFAFNDRATANGAGGSVQADTFIESTVRSDRVDFKGEFSAAGALGNACRTSGAALGSLSTTFTVSRETQAALTGRIELDPPAGLFDPVAPTAQVILTGFSPTGGLVSISVAVGGFTGQTEADIFEPVTLYPDATYALTIGGGVLLGIEDGASSANTAQGTASINVALALGDNDQDGLLDVWETFGIDVDEDGTPELDLPAMGADPNRKDLFIEIDVMQGFAPDPGALADVRDAFANVPMNLITNPDGSTGITLHTIIDQTSLPVTTYPAPPGHYPALQAIKDARFGTPAERASPDWPLIKAARLVSFRYCVWGGTRADNALGFGEILGDDFTVLAGAFANGGTRDLLAGTFMHEFGHTLGLRHGGDSNTNFKPNYISVMNYALAIPSQNFPSQIRDSWRLDFSPRVLPDIDENDFDEIDGYGLLGAPELAGRFTLVRFPVNANTVIARAAPLDQTPFDLTGDGDTNDFGVVDINADGSAEVLTGFNDWTALNLPLRGSENFGDFAFGRGEDTDDEPGGVITTDVLDQIASEFDSTTAPCNIADLAAPFGLLDLADIDAFVIAFVASNPAADLVPPQGIIDLADIDAFITNYLAGCP